MVVRHSTTINIDEWSTSWTRTRSTQTWAVLKVTCLMMSRLLRRRSSSVSTSSGTLAFHTASVRYSYFAQNWKCYVIPPNSASLWSITSQCYSLRQTCSQKNLVFGNVWLVTTFSVITEKSALKRGTPHSTAKKSNCATLHSHLSNSWAVVEHGTDYKIGLRLSVCQCICPSASTLTVAFLDRFSPKLAQT